MSSIGKNNEDSMTGWLHSKHSCNINIGADDYCSLLSKIIATFHQQLKIVNGENKQDIEYYR